MDFLAVLISIFTITVLIVIHEFGHFLAAKFYGFQTPVFGIGLPFGPGIDLFEKWGTKFKFYWALIGGFVAIPELGDESDVDALEEMENLKKPLKQFPVAQRAVVASGGIIFNILFAFLLAVIMAASIGLPKAMPANLVAGFTDDASIAKEIGLKTGDRIIAVNGIKIASGADLQKEVKANSNSELNILVERKNIEDKEELNFKFRVGDSLGIVLGLDKYYEKYGSNPLVWIWEAAVYIFQNIISMIVMIILLFKALFIKLISFVNPSLLSEAADSALSQVKGVVGIVQIISEDIRHNAVLLLEFSMLLSLNLAVINLLPIPALDGGHLVFMAYEAMFGKKACANFQKNAAQIGFIFLIGIILLTTFNDIKNWVFN